MKIRVVSTPTGEAPLSVREQWVGCEFETAGHENCMTRGIEWGPSTATGGYPVTIEDALRALDRLGRFDALEFWESWLNYSLGSMHLTGAKAEELVFDESCCEIIDEPLPTDHE